MTGIEIKLGSLFDGIGGFPLAAKMNGITPVWASEIERFPVMVTRHHFPEMKHMGDITKLRGENLPRVDIIAGGSPCQDLSVAGHRNGLRGERSGLFMEQVRLVKEMRKQDERRKKGTDRRSDESVRPRFMVWENVPGAFSTGTPPGADFHSVLEEVCRIKEDTLSLPGPPGGAWTPAGIILGQGFSVAWRVLDAQFWGLAQRRNRIFLVADLGGESAGEILFESQSLWEHYKEGREARKAASGYFKRSPSVTGEAGNGGVTEQQVFAVHSLDGRCDGPLETAHTLTTNPSDVHLSVMPEPYILAGNIINRAEKNGGNGCGYQQGVCYTLTTEDRHCVYVPHTGNRLYQDVIGALCSFDAKMTGNQYVGQGKCIVDERNRVRRLIPLECERLMGFPEHWTNIKGASDNKRYIALGNSVAVPCVDFILCGIAFVLRREE